MVIGEKYTYTDLLNEHNAFLPIATSNFSLCSIGEPSLCNKQASIILNENL